MFRKLGRLLKILFQIIFREVKSKPVPQICDIKQCLNHLSNIIEALISPVLFTFFNTPLQVNQNNYCCDFIVFILHFEGLIKNKHYREKQLSLNINTNPQIKVH